MRIPFTSETKWSAAVFEGEGTFLVGAPEFIMGGRYPLLREAVETMTGAGFRVLLLAAYDGKPEAGSRRARDLPLFCGAGRFHPRDLRR